MHLITLRKTLEIGCLGGCVLLRKKLLLGSLVGERYVGKIEHNKKHGPAWFVLTYP